MTDQQSTAVTAPAVRSKDGLYCSSDWIAAFVKLNPKLRRGSKMTINTDTFVTTPLYTIEMWHKPQRRWLPLKLESGKWSWEDATKRDKALATLEAYQHNAEVSDAQRSEQ